MKQLPPRIHWIIWPVLLLALAGLALPYLWPASVPPQPTGAPALSTPVTGAQVQVSPQPGISSPKTGQATEQPVTPLPLTGWLADHSSEISGLAWYGDSLILLPQYPRHVTGGKEGYVYAIAKADILNYLDGKSAGPLHATAILFDAYGLRDRMQNFQGFESLAFAGDRLYATIEAGKGSDMMSYLVSGRVEPDLSRITVDTDHLVPIPPQVGLDNKGEEALLLLDDRLLTFYEVNGAVMNPKPVAHVFDLDLQPLGTIPLAPLEYRLTDAARVPGSNAFWVINTFSLADMELVPQSDPLADRFGKGPSHARFPAVERLVKMQYDPSGVTLAGEPPVQLEMTSIEPRNWEGLVLLDDRGFLIATDKYPATILAFVSRP